MKLTTIEEELKNKDPLPQEIEDNIYRYGVLFGSKLFGGYEEGKSDIDIILPFHFPNTYSEILKYGIAIAGYDYSEMSCVYVKMSMSNNRIYNLLFSNNKQVFDLWNSATSIMYDLKNANAEIRRLIKIKKNRTDLFEVIKDMIRRSR